MLQYFVLAASLCAAPAVCGPGNSGEAARADWKRVVTKADRDRLKNWRDAFVAALKDARAGGSGSAIDREGVLLDPDAALGGGATPAGTYRCRVIKLGSQSRGMLAYVDYPAFTCRISADGSVLKFAKINGSQRPVGTIFPDGEGRQIFLGSLVLGDETRALDYGEDPMRDMAGTVERIGENRWRILLPYPNYESIMDVIELTPAG